MGSNSTLFKYLSYLLLLVCAFGCALVRAEPELRAASLQVQDAFMPVPLAGVNQAPLSMTLINTGTQPLVLLGANSDWAGAVTLLDAQAKPLQQLVIGARSQLRLEYKTTAFLLAKGLKGTFRSGEPLHLQLNIQAHAPLAITLKAISAYDQPHH